MLSKLTDVKAWFLHSETILFARLSTISGFVIAAVAAMDWAPLWSIFGTGTKFDYTQLMSIGGFAVFQGLVLELARRRNTVVTEDSTLKPTS